MKLRLGISSGRDVQQVLNAVEAVQKLVRSKDSFRKKLQAVLDQGEEGQLWQHLYRLAAFAEPLRNAQVEAEVEA